MSGTVWSTQTLKILGLFVRQPNRKLHTRAVQRETGCALQTVSETLHRLEERDWLQSERERVDPRLSARPPRTLYKATTGGVDQALALVALLTGCSTTLMMAST
jgi:DNA-binding PadR family transcriptional regulator